MGVTRQELFVSYSRQDRQWLDVLRKHLKPRLQKREICIWDDSAIVAGDKWQERIAEAITRAKVAMLLVTPDFLASDFIARNEFPRLLEASQQNGLRVLWVAVRPSGYAKTPLAEYQALNDPTLPLSRMSKRDVEQAIEDICDEVERALDDKQGALADVAPAVVMHREPPDGAPPPASFAARQRVMTLLRTDGWARYANGEHRPELLETMRVPEPCYPDDLIDLTRERTPVQLVSDGKNAWTEYLHARGDELYPLGAVKHYLIARFLYQSILDNQFSAFRSRPFIYPIHQYLSSFVRRAPEPEREQIRTTLLRWLVSRDRVYAISRDFAAFELGMCRIKQAAPALLQRLADKHELKLVRTYSAMALGMLRATEMLDALLELRAREGDPAIREVMEHAIIFIAQCIL